jgi:hypothetical protein
MLEAPSTVRHHPAGALHLEVHRSALAEAMADAAWGLAWIAFWVAFVLALAPPAQGLVGG